jgi:ATP-dependent helicase HrpA
MREWIDIHKQLNQILKDYRFRDRQSPISAEMDSTCETDTYAPLYIAIHKSILSGFLSNIAVKKEKNFFKAAKGREVMIFPGSTLFNRAKTWIVAAEMVETTRLFARTTANINSQWLEELGKDLCKYTCLEPHWSRSRGEVVASEQVSLFGLIIIPRRPISYGRINPEEATDIFIRSALVEGDIRQLPPFMQHNNKLIDEVRDMEDRIRRRDILVSEDAMHQFYRKKLKRCFDIRTLHQRIKQQGGDRFLRMKSEDIRQYLPDDEELARFPKSVQLGNRIFDCDYRFEPGESNDGLTVNIPSPLAPVVPPGSTDWLVPGLLRKKITALIKGLPKTYRRRLVPVTQTVDVILAEMPPKDRPLITTLGEFIYSRFGVDIPASAWSDDLLPQHLKMRIAITGPKGEELGADRDPVILHRNFSSAAGPQANEAVDAARKKWEKRGLTQWDFEDLPEAITIPGKKAAGWLLYPGLEKDVVRGKPAVNLRLFEHPEEAVRAHKEGVAELLAIHFAKDLKFLKKSLILPKEAGKIADYFGGAKRFEKLLFQTVVNTLFSRNIRSKETLHSHAESTAPLILSTGRALLDSSVAVLHAYHDTRTVLYDLETTHGDSGTASVFLNGLRAELARLVPEAFVQLYDIDRMKHLIRYIKAIAVRAQRALVNFEKDQAKAVAVRHFTESLNAMLQEITKATSSEKRDAVEEFFWLLEEYKVSVFAQELKTAVPVSKKRLEKKLKEIGRMV